GARYRSNPVCEESEASCLRAVFHLRWPENIPDCLHRRLAAVPLAPALMLPRFEARAREAVALLRCALLIDVQPNSERSSRRCRRGAAPSQRTGPHTTLQVRSLRFEKS